MTKIEEMKKAVEALKEITSSEEYMLEVKVLLSKGIDRKIVQSIIDLDDLLDIALESARNKVKEQNDDKLTKNQKKAIKMICDDYGFDNPQELINDIRQNYGETINRYWFKNNTVSDCYEELEQVMKWR